MCLRLKDDFMDERRRLPRHVVLKGAMIAYDQSPPIDCIVCNLTSDGACLHFANTVHAPESFDLSFDNFRSARSCHVAWRKTDKLGVSFG